ncbi:hypothetical protein [Actinomyces sp. 432]|uniref:hypothetical protein n=1 Tax=Actinomyces sp. 432 TaxID=2057798 RepID=UPI00192A190A|nr:hypothetical protein [Actinomyces sp. 432]
MGRTETNQRDDDAYYDTYDEDIAAGRVKPMRTTHRANPGRVSDDEFDAIFRGRPNPGEAHATGAGRSPARHVRFSPATDAALSEYVKAPDTTASAVIREAVEPASPAPEPVHASAVRFQPRGTATRAAHASRFGIHLGMLMP